MQTQLNGTPRVYSCRTGIHRGGEALTLSERRQLLDEIEAITAGVRLCDPIGEELYELAVMAYSFFTPVSGTVASPPGSLNLVSLFLSGRAQPNALYLYRHCRIGVCTLQSHSLSALR